MTRRLISVAVAVVGTAAAALYAAGPSTAVSVLLLAGLLREHALRSGGERRLRAAVGQAEDAMAEIRAAVPEAIERGMRSATRARLARRSAGTDDEGDGILLGDGRTLH